jgi:alkanesulfonate monooxygenase SsuD/methylene tetrahydromethanopterin reductase-like flavin-dependent oxidoreductase (luciferase family)
MQGYRDEALRQGYQSSPDQLGWSIKIYVAETDEIARREAKPHIESFANKFLRMPQEMLLPPGYTSLASMKGLINSRKTITGGYRTMEQMLEQGTFICGSPQTVIEQLAEYQRRGGFNLVMAGLHFATLPHELTRKNLELFAREVMPALKGVVPGEVPRVAAA